jgi:hypothetical protein
VSRRRQQIRSQWGQPRNRERKLDLIRESHQARVTTTGSASLDDRTWEDLNLDAVFEAVDRTESSLGQHALYHRLRTAPVAKHLEAFEALVGRFSTDVALRERAQVALGRLQDPHGYNLWWLGRPDALDAPAWYAIYPLLSVATVLTVVLGIWFHAVPAILFPLVINAVVHVATGRRIQTQAAAFRQLAPLITTARALRFLAGDDIEPIVAPIRREASRLRPLKTLSRWVSGNPFMISFDATPLVIMANDVINVAYDYLNAALLLDGNAVCFGVRRLRAHAFALLDTIAAAGDVDAAIAVASFRAGAGAWTRPRFNEPGTTASFVDLRHPLVAEAVPNSIQLAPPHGVLVTGSNMSGKSTFLRTVGVSAVLAQTIHTCLASEYIAPMFKIRSSIGRSDDLQAGKSYYLVEVEALVGLVRASADRLPHLFLLDELFRGTNAVERIAAGEAVLRELVADAGGTKPHIVIAATHDSELVDLLKDTFASFHFGDSVGPDGLVFDYHLQPGPATTRNAITLLQMQGAPAALVAHALARAAALDRARVTGSPPQAPVRAGRTEVPAYDGMEPADR